jgi:spermidine/putrescine transport system permease protein
MERTHRSPITGAITLTALVFLFVPLIVVVLFSFHETSGLSFPFRGFSLRWYREVFASQEIRDTAKNSLIVATATSAVSLVLGTLAAYGLSRTSARWRGPLALLFFLPLTLPGLFIGLSLLVFFNLVNDQVVTFKLSLVSVAVAHLVYVLPYFLLIAVAALDRLDVALEEAAADLGAGSWTVFRRVTLPQIWPVLLGATSLAFALSFDEFIITFFVIGPQSTVPMFIWSALRRTVNPTINTISTLLLAMTLLMFTAAFLLTLRGGRRHGQDDLLSDAVGGPM